MCRDKGKTGMVAENVSQVLNNLCLNKRDDGDVERIDAK